MKRLARSYVWWPGIDDELERCVKSCEMCLELLSIATTNFTVDEKVSEMAVKISETRAELTLERSLMPMKRRRTRDYATEWPV